MRGRKRKDQIKTFSLEELLNYDKPIPGEKIKSWEDMLLGIISKCKEERVELNVDKFRQSLAKLLKENPELSLNESANLLTNNILSNNAAPDIASNLGTFMRIEPSTSPLAASTRLESEECAHWELEQDGSDIWMGIKYSSALMSLVLSIYSPLNRNQRFELILSIKGDTEIEGFCWYENLRLTMVNKNQYNVLLKGTLSDSGTSSFSVAKILDRDRFQQSQFAFILTHLQFLDKQ